VQILNSVIHRSFYTTMIQCVTLKRTHSTWHSVRSYKPLRETRCLI